MASIYSVGKLNEYIQKMFEQDYLLSNDVSVRGEISNCNYHSSGHIYFSLKESGSVIPCVMFSSHRRNLKFKMQDGQQVVVKGRVDVYVRDGKYQLYASQVQLDGDGELYLAFEQLKARLAAEGMFDAQYKRKIPPYVKTVGVVAAPTGKVIRDIITVSKRRNPYIQVVLYPAIVQGDGAAPSIIRGIEKLEEYGADVIIVGRGGGTIEELWAFNEEAVAHAIFQCGVPVISAVGHETDFTIADLVADKRAATPSEAAEFAVGVLAQTERYMEEYRKLLYKSMATHIERARMKNRLKKQKIQSVSPAAKVREYHMTSARFAEILDQNMQHQLLAKRNRLQILVERMHAVSPVKRLNGGMAYLSDSEGKRISAVKDMRCGDELRIRMKDGEAGVTVREVYIDDVRGE